MYTRAFTAKCILAALLVAAVAGLFYYYATSTGLVHCLKHRVSPSAQNAFLCGNYHFGVYGPAGYDVEQAGYYFNKTIELDPTTPDVWHQFARISFLKGDYDAALFRINKQFEMRGDELMAAYYIRGLIEGYAKDYAAAEKDFLRFLEWSPNNWAASNDLAWIYFAQGKFVEAKAQTERGLKNNPDNVWLLVTHAMSIYNLGDKATAETELLEAKDGAAKLTEANWSRAYPGNDPSVAAEGLASFKKAIETNLALVQAE